jgi:hypothetical protein
MTRIEEFALISDREIAALAGIDGSSITCARGGLTPIGFAKIARERRQHRRSSRAEGN